MASGTQLFVVPNTRGFIHIRLDWWSSSDIAGNCSDVTAVATVVRGPHGYNTNSTSDLSQLFINGHMFESRHHIGGGNNSSTEIARATHRVQHNEDGNKSIEIAFKHDFRLYWGGVWVGMHTFTMSNQQLDSIPRLSDFTVASRVTLGTTTQIIIQPKADIFDHRIRFRWFNRNDMINDFIDKSIRQQSWTPPITYTNNIPNSTSSLGTLVVETWLNGVYIGERTKTVTLVVPDNVKPALNSMIFTEKEANVLKLTNGTAYLQLMSVVNLEYKGFSGIYNSTISKMYTEVVGQNVIIEGNNKTLDKLNVKGDVILKSYVVDSRGRKSNTVTNTLRFIEYHAPVASMSAKRSGKDNQQITINRNIKIAPIRVNGRQKNKIVVTYDINPLQENNVHHSTQEFTTIYELLSSDHVINDTFVTNKSFRVTMKVEDNFFSTTVSFIVGAEQFPIMFHPNGASINTAEKHKNINFFVKGHSRFDGNIYQNGKLLDLAILLSCYHPKNMPTILQSKNNNAWAHATCGQGQNFGDFLKSSKVPIGFSVIRDENMYSNFLVVKENNLWIFGICVNSLSRLETVRVMNGVYSGYRGWALP